MKTETSHLVRASLLAAVAFTVGVGGTAWWFTRPAPSAAGALVADGAGPTTAEPSITLSAEALARGGIRTARVATGRLRDTLRLPGTIEPNQYRTGVVTSIAAGRVTTVTVVAGDEVTEGQLLAEIYSRDVAEAQARYLTMVSEFDAAHQRMLRSERLAAIGAISTQEVERVHAEHTTHETDVETSKAQLRLLGMANDDIAAIKTGADVRAIVRVRAPRAGVVTERLINAGVNVEPGATLFRIIDLDTVWVVAAVHEQDLVHVGLGRAATVTTAAAPGESITAAVSYVDSVVRPETRTASIRIEVPNDRRRFRLGMYAEVTLVGPPTDQTLIPRVAVQTIGGRQVVYVVDRTAPGRLLARVVTTGASEGDLVVVESGLVVGEEVVTEGSFSVRAERERTGASKETAPALTPPAEHRVVVGTNGFEPNSVSVAAGVPLRLTFVRTTDATCATSVVVPSRGLTRELPLHVPVIVDLPAQPAGVIEFACGMNMFKGQLRVTGRP